jgi:hypothetical protein
MSHRMRSSTTSRAARIGRPVRPPAILGAAVLVAGCPADMIVAVGW